MKIIIGDNPPVDSGQVPVMIKLEHDDLQKLKSKPDDHDIVVFHPKHWPENNGRRWATSKIDSMNDATVTTMPSNITPPIQEPVEVEPEPVEIISEPVNVSDAGDEVDSVETTSTKNSEEVVTDNDILNLLGS